MEKLARLTDLVAIETAGIFRRNLPIYSTSLTLPSLKMTFMPS